MISQHISVDSFPDWGGGSIFLFELLVIKICWWISENGVAKVGHCKCKNLFDCGYPWCCWAGDWESMLHVKKYCSSTSSDAQKFTIGELD